MSTLNLRQVRSLSIRIGWVLGPLALHILIASLLWQRVGQQALSLTRNQSVLIALIPALLWILTHCGRNDRLFLRVIGTTLMGGLIAAPIAIFIVSAILVDDRFSTFSLSGLSLGRLFVISAVAAISQELPKYLVLRYAQLGQESFELIDNIRDACSIGIGFSAALLVATLGQNLDAVLDSALAYEMAILTATHVVLGIVLGWCMSRIQYLSSRRWLHALLGSGSIIFLFILNGCLARIDDVFTRQASAILAIVLVFCFLLALLFNTKKRTWPSSKSGLGVVACMMSLVLWSASAISYRIFCAPTYALLTLDELSLSYPTSWFPPQHPKPKLNMGVPQPKHHLETQSFHDPLTRIEARVIKEAEASTLEASLDVWRVTQYGQHHWVEQKGRVSLNGRDWMRTRFTYPYQPRMGASSSMLTGEEFALILDKTLYIVTLHSSAPYIQDLVDLISPTIGLMTDTTSSK